ncbi:MAG: DMT family transporter [Clostridiaceae bacterium]|nr:DMT family transporter [Clostridiaceae bacterium]
MYHLISLLTGILLSVMILINGRLTEHIGLFQATAIIHLVGVAFSLAASLIRKEKPLPRTHSPWWFYLGGVIGVYTAVANNFAFGKITMTSIVALGLLGQTVTSLVVDTTGWFGMTRRSFRKSTLVGLLFCFAGIAVMLDHSILEAVLAVWLSFGTGISIVVSRSINARLATRIGPLPGSFVNHLTGLPVTVILVLLTVKKLPAVTYPAGKESWVYLGGVLGVCVVMLFNILVPRISQFHLTVLSFVGQVLTGILIDLLTGDFTADASFRGGLLITAGIALNLAIEYRAHRKAKSEGKPAS